MDSKEEKEPKKLFTHPRWHEIPVSETVKREKEFTEEEKEAMEERAREWKEDLAKQGIIFDEKKEE